MNLIIIHDTKNDQFFTTKVNAAVGRLVGVTAQTVGNWRRRYPDRVEWNRFVIIFNGEYLPPQTPRTFKDWKIDKNEFGHFEARHDDEEFFLHAKTLNQLKIEINEFIDNKN